MAPFRCSVVIVALALATGCTKSAGQSDGPSGSATAGPAVIDPVMPARDSVGPAPNRFEWTPIKDADRYEIELLTDIDMEVFSHGDVRGTVLPMPDGVVLTPGTYFWRVGAVRNGRLVGDSGRSAFMVRDP
jgi:hypothetical protein